MKHLLLSASLLLSSSSLLAQLHVQPNPITSTDSYVYANDVVLYVHQEVSLIENTNDSETEASIYLRGDAQLIQGDKPLGSINTGSGKLSVWQEGRTNNFGYHNWSTPVGNPQFGAGPGVAGNKNFGITSFYDVELILGDPLNPHPTRSVVALNTNNVNGTRNPLNISRRWIYKLGAQGTYASWIFVGNTDGLSPGDGFTMKGTMTTTAANPQLYDFRGRPNDGTINKGAVPNGINVYLGNPYPSNIDMRDFISANLGIEGTVWYYEKSEAVQSHNLTEIQSGYGTWVPGGGDAIPAEYGGGVAGVYTAPTYVMYDGNGTPLPPGPYGSGTPAYATFAQIGQGFMVRGSANTDPVVFNNTMRRYIPAGTFNDFKNTTTNSDAEFAANIGVTNPDPDPEPDPVNDFFRVESTLRFHIEVNDSYTRDMVLMFSDNTTKGEDRGFDGRHPSVIAGGDSYWRLSGVESPFVIQTRPFVVNEFIPIAFKTNSQKNFKIDIVELIDFNHKVFLYDKELNTYTSLRDNPVELNLPAGTYEERFYITFLDARRQAQEELAENTELISSKIDVFQNNNITKLEIFNPDIIDIKSAAVYDMSGKLLIHERNLGKQQRYSFSTANLSSGVYIVMLTTADDVVIDYKVTVHNKN